MSGVEAHARNNKRMEETTMKKPSGSLPFKARVGGSTHYLTTCFSDDTAGGLSRNQRLPHSEASASRLPGRDCARPHAVGKSCEMKPPSSPWRPLGCSLWRSRCGERTTTSTFTTLARSEEDRSACSARLAICPLSSTRRSTGLEFTMATPTSTRSCCRQRAQMSRHVLASVSMYYLCNTTTYPYPLTHPTSLPAF